MVRAMLMATMVVCVAAVTMSISVTVDQPRGELCIGTFNDLNGDGLQDAGEPDLFGFLFQVSGTGPSTTLTTGPNGGCEDLPAGTYTVVGQPRSGWTATTPATQTVNITAGQAANVLFGSREEPRELCIRMFNDLNGDGVQDASEPGVSGFVFQVKGTGPAIILTTGPNGVACEVLPVGAYTMVEQRRSGWTATTPATQRVTITAGRTSTVFFGSRQERGDLCIRTFNDLNRNGVQEGGEPLLSGFVFQVSGTGGATTLTTNADGVACDVLAVGTYTMVQQPRVGWLATTRTQRTVTITAGQAANEFFGSRQETGDLCLRTFNDLNGNGAQEAGEPALSEFVFHVSGTGPATTLTTDRNGVACEVLPVGTYTVVEQKRTGWTATTPTTQTVTVTAGQTATRLFGGRQARQESGELCIRTFYDPNRNRVQDAGEQDLSEFVFQVRGTGPGAALKMDVKGGGCSTLPFGAYTVVQAPKPGWIATTATTQTVTVTANRATLFFGNRRDDPLCDEADKSRESKIIMDRYSAVWRSIIERERDRFIAATGVKDVRLGRIDPRPGFSASCLAAHVTLSYELQVRKQGRLEIVTQLLRFDCAKAGGLWQCR